MASPATIHPAASRRWNFGAASCHRILSAIFLLLASVAVSGALIEIFIRIYYEGKFGPRPAVYTADGATGWRPTSNLDYVFHGKDFESWIKTDRDGYRVGALGTVPASSKVIVAVGDSYTFGWGAATDQTYPSYLDELVAAESGYRLVNLGVGGYGTLQSALRLRTFADRGARPDVRGIVVLHSHNDMSDNVNFLRFMSGMIKYEEFVQNSSVIHTINFVSQAVDWIKISVSGDSSNFDMPFHRDDEKRGFKKKKSKTLRPIQLGDGSIIRMDEITPEDLSQKTTLNKKRFTNLQTRLLMINLNQINCLAENRKIPVVHILVHSAPNWYEAAMANLVAESAKCGNDIHFAGRISDPIACKECGFNHYSGGHFNPTLNLYYAKVINEYLHDIGVFASSDERE